MLKKFRQYVQRKLADAVRLLENSIEVKANLMAQKYLLITAMNDHNALVQDSLDEFHRAGTWVENSAGGNPASSTKTGVSENLPSLLRTFSNKKAGTESLNGAGTEDPLIKQVKVEHSELETGPEGDKEGGRPSNGAHAREQSGGQHIAVCRKNDGNKAFSEGVISTLRGVHCVLSAQPSVLAGFAPDLERLIRDMTQTLEKQPHKSDASWGASTSVSLVAGAGSERGVKGVSKVAANGVDGAHDVKGLPGQHNPAKQQSRLRPELVLPQQRKDIMGGRVQAKHCDYETRLASLDMTIGKDKDSSLFPTAGSRTGFA